MVDIPNCHVSLRGRNHQGSLYYQPKQGTIEGRKSLKTTIHLNCLIPHEMGSVMIRPLAFLNKALWALCKPLFLTLPLKHLETLWCISTYPSHSHGSVERDAPSWLKLPHLSDAWFLDEVYPYHFPSLRTSVTTVATFSYTFSPIVLAFQTPKPFFPQLILQ